MANFELVDKIKTSIDIFNDAEYYSIAEDNSVVAKNLKDNSLWKFKYNEDKGNISYDTKSAEMVREPDVTKEEIFESNTDNLKDDIQWQKIFDRIEQSYTMREEKELYQAIKQGEGFESAVQRLITKSQQKNAIEGEIELF